LEARYEEGVSVAVDGVGVSGTSAYACFALPGGMRRRGLAGTAVCVELLEEEELEGVGEDGREGVGVTAEEGSVCALVLVGVMVGGCGAGVDVDANGRSSSGF
jgi:hypothetical protein